MSFCGGSRHIHMANFHRVQRYNYPTSWHESPLSFIWLDMIQSRKEPELISLQGHHDWPPGCTKLVGLWEHWQSRECFAWLH